MVEALQRNNVVHSEWQRRGMRTVARGERATNGERANVRARCSSILLRRRERNGEKSQGSEREQRLSNHFSSGYLQTDSTPRQYREYHNGARRRGPTKAGGPRPRLRPSGICYRSQVDPRRGVKVKVNLRSIFLKSAYAIVAVKKFSLHPCSRSSSGNDDRGSWALSCLRAQRRTRKSMKLKGTKKRQVLCESSRSGIMAQR